MDALANARPAIAGRIAAAVPVNGKPLDAVAAVHAESIPPILQHTMERPAPAAAEILPGVPEEADDAPLLAEMQDAVFEEAVDAQIIAETREAALKEGSPLSAYLEAAKRQPGEEVRNYGARMGHLALEAKGRLGEAELAVFDTALAEKMQQCRDDLVKTAESHKIPPGLWTTHRQALTQLAVDSWGSATVFSALAKSGNPAAILDALAQGGQAAVDALDEFMLSDASMDNIALELKMVSCARDGDGERIDTDRMIREHAAARSCRDAGQAAPRRAQKRGFTADTIQEHAKWAYNRPTDRALLKYDLPLYRAAYLTRRVDEPDLSDIDFLKSLYDCDVDGLPPPEQEKVLADIEKMSRLLKTEFTGIKEMLSASKQIMKKHAETFHKKGVANMMGGLSVSDQKRTALAIESIILDNLTPARHNSARSASESDNLLKERLNNPGYKGIGSGDSETALALAALTNHTSRRRINSLNRYVAKVEAGHEKLAEKREAAPKTSPKVAAYLATIRDIDSRLRAHERHFTPNGAIRTTKGNDGAQMSSATLVLDELLNKSGAAMSLEEKKNALAGLELPEHFDLATMRSGKHSMTLQQRAQREEHADETPEAAFRDLLGNLRDAPDAAAFDAASAEMRTFMEEHRLGEKAEALLFLETTKNRLLGRDSDTLYTAAIAPGQRMADTVLAGISERFEDPAALEALRLGGSKGRRSLKLLAGDYQKTMVKEQRHIASFGHRDERRILNGVGDIALVRQLDKAGFGVPFPAMVAAAKTAGDVRDGCLATIKEYLKCSDKMAGLLLDAAIDRLGPNPSLQGMRAATQHTLARKIGHVFRGIFFPPPLSAAAIREQEEHARDLAFRIDPGESMGIDFSRKFGARVVFSVLPPKVAKPGLASAGVEYERSRAVTIDCESEDSFSLSLMKGFGLNLDASLSLVGGGMSAQAGVGAGTASGLKIHFTGREALAEFLAGMTRGENVFDLFVEHADGVAVLSTHSVEGSAGLSGSATGSVVSAGTYTNPKALDAASKVAGWMPFDLEGSVTAGATYDIGHEKQGNREIKTTRMTYAFEAKASAGLTSKHINTTLTQEFPHLLTLPIFVAAGAKSTPGLGDLEAFSKAAAAKGGHRFDVKASASFVRDRLFRTETVGGRLSAFRREDVSKLTPANLARPDVIKDLFEKNGITSEKLQKDLVGYLAMGMEVSLVVKKEFTPEALQRNVGKGEPGLLERHNEKNFFTTGFELRFDVAKAQEMKTVVISPPIEGLITAMATYKEGASGRHECCIPYGVVG